MPAEPLVADPIPAASPILEVPLSSQVLNELYGKMMRARLLTRRFRKYPQVAEAIVAGTLQNLETDDIIVTAAPAFSSEPLADSTPAPTSNLILADPGAAIGIAAGLAYGLTRSRSSAVALAIVPGKSTANKAAEQVFNFATANRAPIVFVADWTNSRASARNHDGRELSHWPFPTIAVDGRDPIAVYRVSKEAISAARRGHGPTLIDCVNFLAPGRRGRDDRDPLVSFRKYLERHNAWSDLWHSQLQARLKFEMSPAKRLSQK